MSIDTYYPYVAEKSLELGADIINDVSGIINPDMAKIIKDSKAGWVIMHNGAGTPDDIKEFLKIQQPNVSDLALINHRFVLIWE